MSEDSSLDVYERDTQRIARDAEHSPAGRWMKGQAARERRGDDTPLYTPRTFGPPERDGIVGKLLKALLGPFGDL